MDQHGPALDSLIEIMEAAGYGEFDQDDREILLKLIDKVWST